MRLILQFRSSLFKVLVFLFYYFYTALQQLMFLGEGSMVIVDLLELLLELLVGLGQFGLILVGYDFLLLEALIGCFELLQLSFLVGYVFDMNGYVVFCLSECELIVAELCLQMLFVVLL